MKNEEIELKGGQSTANVVRIGNTVHRTKSVNAPFTNALLLHLEKHNFPYAPRILGTDKKGKEILSYIDGEVPRGITLSIDQIKGAIKILRGFHDVMSSSPLCKGQETVCHNDFAPWNLILKNGIAVGLIDYDDAAPGGRIDDFAYFIWTFLDLGIAPISDKIQFENITALANTYGLLGRSNLAEALLKEQHRILDFRQKVVAEEQNVELRDFSKGAVIRIQKSTEWVQANKSQITNY